MKKIFEPRFLRLTAISLLIFSLLTMTTATAADTDSLMRAEADIFLAKLPDGLRHNQTQAVRKAINGDNESLEAVRHSRNSAPAISDNVKVIEPAATLRLYEPKGVNNEKLPLLIYLHGGGWTFGSLNSCARYCNAITEHGGLKVLAVDYRLAPEHPFPAGLDDCVNAVNYAICHAEELGIDTSRISVGGDSSGGNLALATALSEQCRGTIRSLVLFYPVTKAFDDNSKSWRSFGDGYGLDADLMQAFNDAYCVSADPRDPIISIGLCNSQTLSFLPPTLLIAAGRDILCDQGRELAMRLSDKVKRIEFPEAVHLFITVPGQDTAFDTAVSLSRHFLLE